MLNKRRVFAQHAGYKLAISAVAVRHHKAKNPLLLARFLLDPVLDFLCVFVFGGFGIGLRKPADTALG